MRVTLIKDCKLYHKLNWNMLIISFFISYKRNVSFINILQNIDPDNACMELTHTSITFVWKKLKDWIYHFLYILCPLPRVIWN